MYEAMAKREDNVQIRVINHIENIRGLTTKTGLVRSLKLYYKRCVAASKCLFNNSSGRTVWSLGNYPNLLHNNASHRRL